MEMAELQSFADSHGGRRSSGPGVAFFGFILTGSWAETLTTALPLFNLTEALDEAYEYGTIACRSTVVVPPSFVGTYAVAVTFTICCASCICAFLLEGAGLTECIAELVLVLEIDFLFLPCV